jgi:hypothetical protein
MKPIKPSEAWRKYCDRCWKRNNNECPKNSKFGYLEFCSREFYDKNCVMKTNIILAKNIKQCSKKTP